jgi:hypothetical protein
MRHWQAFIISIGIAALGGGLLGGLLPDPFGTPAAFLFGLANGVFTPSLLLRRFGRY